MQNRALSLSLTFLTLILLTNCSKDKNPSITPTANFTYESVGSNTHAPATVKFTNNSLNAGSYRWDFGDGTTSSDTNPSHKFTGAGVYSVSLKVTVGSKTDTKIQTINIQPPHTKIAITTIRQISSTESSSFNGYFRFADASNNQLWRSATVTINPAAFPTNWSLANPYVFNNLSGSYYIEVWKQGTISDTKIASTLFIPSLFNIGDIAANSYPADIPGSVSSGINFIVHWQ